MHSADSGGPAHDLCCRAAHLARRRGRSGTSEGSVKPAAAGLRGRRDSQETLAGSLFGPPEIASAPVSQRLYGGHSPFLLVGRFRVCALASNLCRERAQRERQNLVCGKDPRGCHRSFVIRIPTPAAKPRCRRSRASSRPALRSSSPFEARRHSFVFGRAFSCKARLSWAPCSRSAAPLRKGWRRSLSLRPRASFSLPTSF